MIELAGLTKRYGGKTAVDDLTFSVRPGIVTGFLGPNGAGKSTTMRMMLGLDHPTSGEVLIDGERYDRLRDPLLAIGALLEAKAVHPGRTAYNHLLCLAQSNGIARERIDVVLDLVGLGAVARKRPKGFSLGMGQRLGIASALLGDPRILMFDEPVNGLDPEGIHWIRNLMKRLAADGRTVFVSSHLMSEMALTAEHLVVIGQGRLLADTSMADFIRENSRSFVRVRGPEPERLRAVLERTGDGVTVTETAEGALEVEGTEAARIGELVAGQGLVLHELSPQQASLEEAFMRLTHGSVEYEAHNGGEGPGAPDPPGAPPAAGGWGAQWDSRRGKGE
ncbi:MULTISPECIES: ABC transporter ATP-binding protein [Streptomyces]|uniref:ABC transporter ATP-binding protein n=1 Tax=Streptomyces TaxID=1883 RepID=UPI0004C715F7|nr:MULTISPECIES: ATP-binding cassette domain-containing protein [unclassified Streptomyces]MCU4749288.1 ATP-binding cassette domain-containing protein [Streptomyces sp. G-5]QQN77178.1 ATP-binding cassette domain-containing protein [Streptomyces sp. XC 2026]